MSRKRNVEVVPTWKVWLSVFVIIAIAFMTGIVYAIMSG